MGGRVRSDEVLRLSTVTISLTPLSLTPCRTTTTLQQILHTKLQQLTLIKIIWLCTIITSQSTAAYSQPYSSYYIWTRFTHYSAILGTIINTSSQLRNFTVPEIEDLKE